MLEQGMKKHVPSVLFRISNFRFPTSLFPLLLVLAVSIFSFFLKLSFIPVRIWDESRNAMNAWYMYHFGHTFSPYYEGAPDMWNTKPPLLIWAQVLSMHFLGINEFALRFPSALAAMGTCILLLWFCTIVLGRAWCGVMSAAVLATSMAYVSNHGGRTGDYDAPVVFFMCAY